MSKNRNNYIKYKRAELEEYITHSETCVRKIRTVESLRFAPNIIGTFTESIMKILSKKIGKFDMKLDGVVLDFRKTKVLSTRSLARTDSTSMLIDVESDFYVFSPRRDAIVNGIVKHINRQSMETIISVVIYRVFNVKVTFKGNIKDKYICTDQEIQLRIKDFHFDNVFPYIEGEMVAVLPRKINYDDVADSGISESSVTSPKASTSVIIKQEIQDIEYEEPINSFVDSGSSRKRKRREGGADLDSTQISQPSKKIKQEIIDEPPPQLNIKQEIMSEDDDIPNESLRNVTLDRVKKLEVPDSSNESPKEKKKKKDKKHKKDKSKKDDFESSLFMLFGTPK